MTLSQFILREMEAILSEWERFARTIGATAGMDSTALRDEAARILTTIAHDMARSQTPAEQEAKSWGQAPRAPGASDTGAERHSHERLGAGFSMDELVSEYRALRASVLRLWAREPPAADPQAIYDITRFNEGIDQALSESIARYTDLHEHSRELFLGILGHDLRTPIGVVLMSAQFLIQQSEAGTEQAKAASRILRSGSRIKQMVADLLDISHIRLGGSLPVDVRRTDLAATCHLVADETRALHPQRNVVLTLSGDLAVDADASRVAQLFSNLLQNAIQHGREGTPITASARGDENGVLIAVHNEGPPISESARAHIFEPLVRGQADDERAATGSLGLGLYIAREIAAAHGGSIDVESSLAKGTTFTARIPRRGT